METLHDWLRTGDGVTVVVVPADAYTPELLARYPQAAELPSIFQVLAPDGSRAYVLTEDALLDYIALAGSGRGGVAHYIRHGDYAAARQHAQTQARAWQAAYTPPAPAKKAKPARKKTQASLAHVLAQVDVDAILGE